MLPGIPARAGTLHYSCARARLPSMPALISKGMIQSFEVKATLTNSLVRAHPYFGRGCSSERQGRDATEVANAW